MRKITQCAAQSSLRAMLASQRALNTVDTYHPDIYDNQPPKLPESTGPTGCSALHVTSTQSVHGKERQGEREGGRRDGQGRTWLETVEPKAF